ncbi:Lipocalin-like domain-containing protein [Chryseobacterium arachidis]|uniref:Lipocalin-like domain-containing protein n=1 Tax=Chryseobacterium arachidis TaxID=1416778 RepID=A0A1M4ZVG8_9FLAO|nr:lipocalin family protein [Chryseobacterium arachidis]SHF22009.1 Lipocalin-like domain-containing protein [Chryseobacterium arachidis]
MRLFINLFILMATVISCSNDDNREDTIIETPNLNGTWKPVRYEYKGKTYPLSECEKKGQILVNTNSSGVYERYGASSSGTDCNLYDSFSGSWNYDAMNRTLTLSYNENGTPKTLQKQIEDFSSTELKVTDTSKDLDNVPGNDEASLVFAKQ